MADTFITGADLSHDGVWAAYSTLTVDESADTHRLWIRSVDAVGDPPTVVDLPGPAIALTWSSVEHVLAVVSPVDGVAQIVLVDLDGNWRQLTHTDRGVAGRVCWSPEGTELAAAIRPSIAPSVDRIVSAMDGIGSINDQVSDVHLVDVATGNTAPLTDGPCRDVAPVFSASGEHIVFARSHAPDTHLFAEQPLVVDRKGHIEEMGWTAAAYSTMVPIADGRMALCSTRQSDRPRGVPASLYVRGLDGELHDRSAGLDLHLLLSTLSDQPSTLEDPRRVFGLQGQDAIVGVCRSGAAEVVRIALDGPVEATTILDGERGCHPLAVKGDRLLFAESTMHRPPVLRMLDLTTAAESTVVDPNPTRPERAFDVTPLDVHSHGDRIQSWFLAPTDTGATPLPTVLIVHGGPYEAFGHCYYGDAHALIEAGYGVVIANCRGSIGYGADFATSIFGRPGIEDFDDLMAAIDSAVDAGLADGDRLAVCGLSYGGYMSAHLAARTSRFRAAVIENPMIEMRSFRDTSDIGLDLLDEMATGGPDDVPEVYRNGSPLHYADGCRTPSRLILGEHDLRCPPSQGLMFHEALRLAGCETDVVWLPGAAHADSAFGPHHIRAAQDDALVEWIQRHNPV
jgi:dipeptidyl aminopeptidase/acylaminoacyl peptidase